MVACLERLPRFLAKSTLWSNPLVRPLLQLARSIPVHRHQDGAVDPRDNERALAHCRAELAGKDLLPPTSLMGGATSWMVVPPVAVEPAQLRIHTVSVSPQAAGDCSQQL